MIHPVNLGFTFSGRWAAFDQTTTLLKNIGLYVIREGIGNDTLVGNAAARIRPCPSTGTLTTRSRPSPSNPSAR